MRISELSARSGVSPRLVRYYEEQGLVTSTRAPNGYREFDDDAVEVVRTIRSMFQLGFSSEKVRAVLPCATGRHDDVDAVTVRETVAEMRSDIDRRIQELVTTREALTLFLDRR
ncbi:MerR family transcriptional regulator [Myceligenerans salitolerans]|uniref:MerR family transcriptional regulator n=1 Tax=Myceligenerans salitolerans TaxID=1230528 RepID=A0ABS3ICQ6_9MICO|nr:MerR family transcriptional regulator [Myceligenerans salitolerans]MBO0610755.1 MerR family transcriptional regulator [Myceligenerans salitolerans]